MSEDNFSSDKTTIKVKLAGEDYHDIVFDWSDNSFEYQQQQLFRQLESYTGIPNAFVTLARIFNPVNNAYFTNMESLDKGYENKWPFTKESVLQILNDGDRFHLSNYIEPFRIEGAFRMGYHLLTEDMVHPTQCTYHWCHYIETRNFAIQKRRIVLNSELAPQIIPLLPLARLQHFDQNFRVMELFNIRQFFDPCCNFIGKIPGHKHKRRYPPYNG